MDTAAYMYIWLTAQIAAVLIGCASHYAHANLSLPGKMIDSHDWVDHAINESLNDGYVWHADYDEQGFWVFDSTKNLMLHVVPISFVVLLVGLTHWPDRTAAVAKVCGAVAAIGMKPLFCP